MSFSRLTSIQVLPLESGREHLLAGTSVETGAEQQPLAWRGPCERGAVREGGGRGDGGASYCPAPALLPAPPAGGVGRGWPALLLRHHFTPRRPPCVTSLVFPGVSETRID